MRQSVRKKKKVNDLGMTLVEVIIAMAIISVAIAPILRVMIYAIQLNVRAREQQRQNYVAQTVMEGFKGSSVEDLYHQFNQTLVDGAPTEFTVCNGAVVESYAVSSTAFLDGDGVFQKADDDTYTFTIESMEVDRKKYDVRVSMEPVTDAALAPQSWTVADAENIDADTDAVYTQVANQDQEAYYRILEEIIDTFNDELDARAQAVGEADRFSVYVGCMESNLLTDWTDADGNLHKNSECLEITRTLTVEIQAGMVTVFWEYGYEVKEEYAFELLDGTAELLGTGADILTVPAGEIRETYLPEPDPEIVFDAGTAETPEKVFIFYYPAYEEPTGVKDGEDTISLVNNTGRAVSVYLLKQVAAGYSDIELALYETGYHSVVEGSGSDILLYHNLDTDLSSGDPFLGASRATFGGSISQAKDDPTLVGATSELLADSDKVFLYHVKVEVFGEESGFSGEPLLILDGSKNSK